MKHTGILSRGIAALVILPSFAAHAATQVITASGDPTNGGSGVNPAWATAANWSGPGGAALPGIGDIAQITYAGVTRSGIDIRGSGFNATVPPNYTEVQGVAFAGAATAEVDLENNSTSANMTLGLNGGAGAVPLIQTGGYFVQITGAGFGTVTTTTKTLTLQLTGSGNIDTGTGGLAISAPITQGSAGKAITKTGAGRLTLSGANTFSGGTTVSSGILEVAGNGALGTGAAVLNGGTLEINLANTTLTASSITVNAGGQIATRGAVVLNNNLTLNGGTLATRTADVGEAYAGAVNVAADSFVNLRSYTTPANSLSINITGVLSGSAALAINGVDPQTNGANKALVLTNPANTFSGAYNVASGQILRNLPATTGKTIGTGTVRLTNATLQLRDDGAASASTLAYGNNVAVLTSSTIDVDRVGTTNTGNIFQLGTLDIGAQTLTTSGANTYAVRFAGATTMTGAATFNVTSAPLTLGDAVSGAFDFTKAGGSTMTLEGATANTFGTTTVSGGALIANKTAGVTAIPGDLIIASGANFRLLASDQIANGSSVTINGGSFGDIAAIAGPALNGPIDTVANVTLNGGTFLSGRNLAGFTVGTLLKVTSGLALAQRGGVISAPTVQLSGGSINLDGGSTTPGNESRLNVGSGGLTIMGATINFNAGPSTLGATSQGSILALGGDLISTGTTNLLNLTPAVATVAKAAVDLGGAVRTFSIGSGTTTIAAAIQNGGIVKTGAGTLTLTGGQSYSTLHTMAGVTNVEADALNASVTDDAILNFTVNETLSDLTITAGGIVTIGSLGPEAAPSVPGSLAGTSAVPEPGAVSLLLLGAASLLTRRRGQRD